MSKIEPKPLRIDQSYLERLTKLSGNKMYDTLEADLENARTIQLVPPKNLDFATIYKEVRSHVGGYWELFGYAVIAKKSDIDMMMIGTDHGRLEGNSQTGYRLKDRAA